jgi:hypothetical protein
MHQGQRPRSDLLMAGSYAAVVHAAAVEAMSALSAAVSE